MNRNNPGGAPAQGDVATTGIPGDPAWDATLTRLDAIPAGAVPTKRTHLNGEGGTTNTVTEYSDGSITRKDSGTQEELHYKRAAPAAAAAAAPAKAGYAATMPYHSSAPVTGFVPQVVGAFAKYYAGGQ